jgi:hypothetical protein
MRLAGYSDMKHPVRSREHSAGNGLDRLLAGKDHLSVSGSLAQ